MNTNISTKIYFKNLDALRFFAFLSVFISHVALFLGYETSSSYFTFIKNFFLVHGDLGVNFFFVLSGFLITFLLFSEKAISGKISLRHFYIRRVLRIWPLYFLTLILGFFVVSPLASHSGIIFPFVTAESYGSLPWYIFLGANIKMAFIGAGSVVLAVLWSVSVEEQFYLIWPTIVSFISDKKNIFRIALCIILVSFCYRFYYYDNYNIVKYSTFSVMSDLAIGAIGAYISLYFSSFCKLIKNCPRYLIGLIYIAGFILIPLRTLLPLISSTRLYQFLYTLEPLAFSLFFIFIILEQNLADHSFVKFGNFKVFNYLGVRSYGLYCYHMIAVFFVSYAFSSFTPNPSLAIYLIEIIIALLLTISIAAFSYRFFEKKFLHLKKRYGYSSMYQV